MIRKTPKTIIKHGHDVPLVAVGAAAMVVDLPPIATRKNVAKRLVDLIDGAALPTHVTVGADATTPPVTDPTTSTPTSYGFLLPTGLGAAAGVGAGFFFGASPIIIGALGVVGGGVGYLISMVSSSSSSTTGMKCPDVGSDQFLAVINDIKSGKENADTAETVAKNYETGGCADAAKQIRAAIPPAKGTPIKGGGVIGPTLPTIPTTPAPKPTIGSAFMKHKLTAAEAAEQVFQFRIDAGFPDDASFLAANGAIAVFPPIGKTWPPAVPFQYVAFWPTGSDPTDPYGYWDKALTFTPTGKIASGLNAPTYMGPDGVEYYFPNWTGAYTTTHGGGGYEGTTPQRVYASAGQRMQSDTAVWVWDEGMIVNIKIDSNIGKKDTAAKGGS